MDKDFSLKVACTFYCIMHVAARSPTLGEFQTTFVLPATGCCKKGCIFGINSRQMQ